MEEMNEDMAEDVLELLDNVSQTWEGIQPKNEPVIYASQFFTNLSQLASFRCYMAGKETALNNSSHSETILNSGGQSANHSQEYLPTVSLAFVLAIIYGRPKHTPRQHRCY
jgi:hypothetical protein